MASSRVAVIDSNEPTTTTIPINSLPPEIRDLIWEFSLPGQRVFQVRYFNRQRHAGNTNNAFFIFQIRYPPPAATRVCRESRAVAMRKGFFLSEHKNYCGDWFNPEVDILYCDRNQRTVFRTKPGEPRIAVPGWDRVLHFGLEWRAFFRDTPRPAPGETTAEYWRAAIGPLQTYMPNLKTFNYILPKVRHKGGPTWGREAHHAQQHEAKLVPLPGGTQIPWRSERNTGNARQAMLGEMTTLGLTGDLVSWDEVKADIERSFELEGPDEGTGESGGVKDDERDAKDEEWDVWRPEIVGWWLLRPGAPKTPNDPMVVEFDR